MLFVLCIELFSLFSRIHFQPFTVQCPSNQIIGVPDRSSVKIGENPSTVVKMPLMHAIRSSPIHGSRQVSDVLILFTFAFFFTKYLLIIGRRLL